jgi:excisionase family DNA binding protein
MEKFLRPSEVARLLKLNTETVYHYIKKGDLPAARLGRKYIVTESDLENFIYRRKEAHRIEKLNLSDKGKEMVETVQLNAERVSTFIDEYPGASLAEITEALQMDAEDAERALHRLKGNTEIHCKVGEGETESSRARWYAGSGEGSSD